MRWARALLGHCPPLTVTSGRKDREAHKDSELGTLPIPPFRWGLNWPFLAPPLLRFPVSPAVLPCPHFWIFRNTSWTKFQAFKPGESPLPIGRDATVIQRSNLPAVHPPQFASHRHWSKVHEYTQALAHAGAGSRRLTRLWAIGNPFERFPRGVRIVRESCRPGLDHDQTSTGGSQLLA